MIEDAVIEQISIGLASSGYGEDRSIGDSSMEVALRALDPISLPEALARAELMTRVDRKYIVGRPLFERMVGEMGPSLRCLAIDDRRVARYRSIYFDTAELTFFHQHLQGRRRRFKVRSRTYIDSGTTMLEVKAKGLRSVTVKERLPWRSDVADHLDDAGDGFVAGVVGSETYRGALAPVVESYYRRATLVDESSESRITCDVDLRFALDGVEATGCRDEVLIETKSAGGRCPADRWLRANGARPKVMSKYCLGVALLYPQVRANPWHRVLRRHFEWSQG